MKSVYSAVRTGSLNKAVCGKGLNGTACPVPVIKQPSSRAEVKNVWSYTYIPLCAFMACTGTTLRLPYTRCM